MRKFLLVLLLVASPLWAADIEAPTVAPEHTLVELHCKTPGKGYAWQVIGEGLLPARVKVDSGNKSHAVFTGKPGRYVAMVFVLTEDGGLDQGQALITIGKGPKPDPDPDPMPDPDPDPDPPVVDVPPELLPAVNALKAFAPQRAKLSKFYADFSTVLAAADVKTTGQFAAAHAAALKAFVAASGYAGAPKVGEHIDAYLAECVGGLDDKPLDAEHKARLVAALKVISEVLR